jgi:phosphate-selective porin OprO/OprP
VRLMLNYYLTENAIGNAGPGTPNRTDTPSVISFRTQLSF